MFNDPSLASADHECATAVTGPAPTGEKLTDALARKYLVRVIAHAKRLARRLPAHVSLGDLISAGMLGVVEGFLRYDPSRTETLDAYLDHRIRGALLDELRRHDPLTRVQRDFARKLTRAARLAANTGASTGEESLAAALGLGLDELREKVTQVNTALALRSTGEEIGADDTLDYQGLTPDEALDVRQRHGLLACAAAALPPRDREMLSLHYEEGHTLREIGDRLGVSESRVSQLHSRAIERLRAQLAA